jgi:hypothetical protein
MPDPRNRSGNATPTGRWRVQEARALCAVLLALLGRSSGWLAAAQGQPSTDSPSSALRAVCTIQDERIRETSGMVASRRHPGLVYLHNDSGDEPLVYAVDRDGRTRFHVRLSDARNVDFEDISLAPGREPGTFDVCVADIGDNKSIRGEVVIYRFPEPETMPAQPEVVVRPLVHRITYADGPQDAEGFCVHPRTGDGYILTKRTDGTSRVYRLAAPWNPSETTHLERYMTLQMPAGVPGATIITAADLSSDGRILVARSYLSGWEWRLPPGGPDNGMERLLAQTPARLALPAERQGESLCFTADDRALLTVSEGKSAVIHEFRLDRE